MRIVIATGIYPPQVGGPATYSKTLHDTLPDYGHDVTVVNFGSVLSLPKIVRHFVYFFRVARAARRGDIIYAQDPVSAGFPALLAARLLRKKFVLKVVGDYAWEQGTARAGVSEDMLSFAEKCPKYGALVAGRCEEYSFLVRVLKCVQYFTARGANVVITPSEYLKRVVSAWGIAPERICVVYNAHEGTRAAGGNGARTREGLRKDLKISFPLVLSAGRLVSWKGFPALIRAVAMIKDEFPFVKLFIAGDGPERGRLAAMIKKERLSDQVMLLGSLPQAMLFKYLQVADVFALNTAYEGFSHQLLEVMAAGTPIVSTAVGGNPELIENQREGILVPHNDERALADALRETLRGGGAVTARVAAARAKAAQFTKARMIEGLLSVLSRI